MTSDQESRFSRKTRINAKSWGAECFGTFVLVLFAVGPTAFAPTGTFLAGLAPILPALAVMALIYSVADISGAHFNPAVTLAFAVRGDMPWRAVPGYLVSQFVGAILAAGFVFCLVGSQGVRAGATIPPDGVSQFATLAIEIMLTTILIVVILSTAVGSKVVGHNAALAVCATIAIGGLLGSPFGGGSMNPARSIAPDLFCGEWASMWVFVVGPLLGALLAVGIVRLLKGTSTEHEQVAAAGDELKAFKKEKPEN